MARTGIMTLDMATQFGYGVERPGRDPILGSVSLATVASHPGAKFCILIDWLAPMFKLHRPEKVVYESPLLFIPKNKFGKPVGNPQTLKFQIGLANIVEMLCCRYDIEVSHASAKTARKFFCGDGNADKDAVMAECRRRGWEPIDHNAGDAGCLLDLAVHLFYPGEYRRSYAAGRN